MTDELVKRLRNDWFGYEVSLKAIDAMDEAAARIEQLTAERDKYESSWMTAEGKLADAEALIEAQAKDHASNNIRFAEAEHHAKTAEVERDLLREALKGLMAHEPDYSDTLWQDARAALKGETP